LVRWRTDGKGALNGIARADVYPLLGSQFYCERDSKSGETLPVSKKECVPNAKNSTYA
jgi:hypothetical protein